jgi:hypothetical protein
MLSGRPIQEARGLLKSPAFGNAAPAAGPVSVDRLTMMLSKLLRTQGDAAWFRITGKILKIRSTPYIASFFSQTAPARKCKRAAAQIWTIRTGANPA